MKHSIFAISFILSALCIGCAVHDGHEDEPAPIWWPTFLYRPTTHPTQEEYDQTNARPLPPGHAQELGEVATG
jgi:hypothetical protein